MFKTLFLKAMPFEFVFGSVPGLSLKTSELKNLEKCGSKDEMHDHFDGTAADNEDWMSLSSHDEEEDYEDCVNEDFIDN